MAAEGVEVEAKYQHNFEIVDESLKLCVVAQGIGMVEREVKNNEEISQLKEVSQIVARM